MPKNDTFFDSYIESVIAQVKENNPSFNLINLENQVINDEQVVRLTDAIKNNPYVTQINLRTNLTIESMKLLRDALRDNEHVKQIELSEHINLPGYSQLKEEIEGIVVRNLRNRPHRIG